MERMQPEDDEDRRQIPTHMPFIVIIADEIADLMMTAAKEVEDAHHSPGAEEPRGRHPPGPGDAEADRRRHHGPDQVEPAGPGRFQVASRTDSRVVLDEMGADKLLGQRRHAVPAGPAPARSSAAKGRT